MRLAQSSSGPLPARQSQGLAEEAQQLFHRRDRKEAGVAMSAARKQASTRSVSLRSIFASRAFERGLDEVRRGLPLDPDIVDIDEWDYERGRHFGFIAPLDMPLRIGRALNPKALRLAEAAFNRKLLI